MKFVRIFVPVHLETFKPCSTYIETFKPWKCDIDQQRVSTLCIKRFSLLSLPPLCPILCHAALSGQYVCIVVNFTKNLKYYKFPLYFRIYLLLLQLHLLAEAPQGVSGRVQSLWKRAFIWRLSLTFETSQLSKTVKGQDNDECPRLGVLCLAA